MNLEIIRAAWTPFLLRLLLALQLLLLGGAAVTWFIAPNVLEVRASRDISLALYDGEPPIVGEAESLKHVDLSSHSFAGIAVVSWRRATINSNQLTSWLKLPISTRIGVRSTLRCDASVYEMPSKPIAEIEFTAHSSTLSRDLIWQNAVNSLQLSEPDSWHLEQGSARTTSSVSFLRLLSSWLANCSLLIFGIWVALFSQRVLTVLRRSKLGACLHCGFQLDNQEHCPECNSNNPRQS